MKDPIEIEGLTYPCEIDVKVFLKANENNIELVRDVLLQSISSEDLINISSRSSSKGKYQAFSCKIMASSKDMMDDLYKVLTSHPEVIMVI